MSYNRTMKNPIPGPAESTENPTENNNRQFESIFFMFEVYSSSAKGWFCAGKCGFLPESSVGDGAVSRGEPVSNTTLSAPTTIPTKSSQKNCLVLSHFPEPRHVKFPFLYASKKDHIEEDRRISQDTCITHGQFDLSRFSHNI